MNGLANTFPRVAAMIGDDVEALAEFNSLPREGGKDQIELALQESTEGDVRRRLTILSVLENALAACPGMVRCVRKLAASCLDAPSPVKALPPAGAETPATTSADEPNPQAMLHAFGELFSALPAADRAYVEEVMKATATDAPKSAAEKVRKAIDDARVTFKVAEGASCPAIDFLHELASALDAASRVGVVADYEGLDDNARGIVERTLQQSVDAPTKQDVVEYLTSEAQRLDPVHPGAAKCIRSYVAMIAPPEAAQATA